MASTLPRTADLREDTDDPLRLSKYEQAVGVVYSLLLMLGILVLGLLVSWFSLKVFFRPPQPPILVESIGGGRGDNPPGVGEDSAPLSLEDQELAEANASEPTLIESLDILAKASQTAAMLDPTFDNVAVARASGLGDRRRPGPQGDGDGDGIPRHERWEIRFNAGATLNEYARQLDFFGIELAAIGGGELSVRYASDLAISKPKTRVGDSKSEKRLRMSWRSGELQEADRELLKKAGIDTAGKVILQFYPPQTENSLALAEKAFAGKRQVNEIRRTLFGVRRAGNRFEFYVIRQLYF